MKTAGVLLLYKARVTQDICIEVMIPLSHFLLPALLLPPFTLRRNLHWHKLIFSLGVLGRVKSLKLGTNKQ